MAYKVKANSPDLTTIKEIQDRIKLLTETASVKNLHDDLYSQIATIEANAKKGLKELFLATGQKISQLNGYDYWPGIHCKFMLQFNVKTVGVMGRNLTDAHNLVTSLRDADRFIGCLKAKHGILKGDTVCSHKGEVTPNGDRYSNNQDKYSITFDGAKSVLVAVSDGKNCINAYHSEIGDDDLNPSKTIILAKFKTPNLAYTDSFGELESYDRSGTMSKVMTSCYLGYRSDSIVYYYDSKGKLNARFNQDYSGTKQVEIAIDASSLESKYQEIIK